MKKLSAILLIICMLLSLCACGSSKSYSYASDYEYEAAEAVSYSAAGGLSSLAMEDADYIQDKSANYSSSSDDDSSAAPDTNPEKIIYSADITLETMSFDETVSGITELIKSYGGFIESSSINGTNLDLLNKGSSSKASARYTIRVPANRFDELVNSLSDLGNIPSKNIYSDNITSQYYDSQARLNNYQVQEQRLLELINRAENLSDIIELERELSDVRYRIESVQSTLKNWDNQVSYSTVNLSVKEVKKYEPAEEDSYLSKLGSAFSDGIEVLGYVVLGIISMLPVIIFGGVIITGIVFLVKRGKKKRSLRKAAKAEAKKASEDKKGASE